MGCPTDIRKDTVCNTFDPICMDSGDDPVGNETYQGTNTHRSLGNHGDEPNTFDRGGSLPRHRRAIPKAFIRYRATNVSFPCFVGVVIVAPRARRTKSFVTPNGSNAGRTPAGSTV